MAQHEPAQLAHTYRWRIHFAKTEGMRFTSHLDVHLAWERTLRRARLPLAYSCGFSPRPRMTVACALPLGCTSEGDLIDVWLEEERSAESILQALQTASPPGLRVTGVGLPEPSEPSLPQQVVAAEYFVSFEPPLALEELQSRVGMLLSKPMVLRHRRGKAYDLRPLIQDMEVLPEHGAEPLLRMRLTAQGNATGRPDEVLRELGLEEQAQSIHRSGLFLRRSGG